MSITQKHIDAIQDGIESIDKENKTIVARLDQMEDVAAKGTKHFEGVEAANDNSYKLDIKSWKESGIPALNDFIKHDMQVKGLPLDGDTALMNGVLNVDVIEQAISNNAVLDALSSRGVENQDYRRTVLTTRPEVLLTAENTQFVAVDETAATAYDTIAAEFTKIYAYPQITNEVADQSDFGVMAQLQKLIAEQFSHTIQNQVISGSGLGTGTKADPQNLRGITNACIDRAANYAEALKPASTRLRNVFGAVASGDADSIGSTSDEVEANLYKLMLAVPERSQANAKFIMHPETLSFLMQTLKDTQGRSLISIELIEENSVWTRRVSLFGATIILCEEMDVIGTGTAPIVFGDIKAGYELLFPKGATHSILDPYTTPDVLKFYSDQIVGSTVVDHEAIAVLVATV